MKYDERLNELREDLTRKRHLDSMVQKLRREERELREKVCDLEAKKQTEQADVDKLQARSLSVFFFRLFGSLDEKLTKEQEEAYAAAVKYDAAVRELSAVEEDLLRYGEEASALRASETEYNALLKEKRDAVRASGSLTGEELLRLEEKLSTLKGQKKELAEAYSAGERALSLAENIQSELDDAEGWGMWDLMGGGIVSDLAKHSHLDDAQTKTEQLQVALRRFRTELSDVQIEADMQVNIDGFLRFADYFFDGLFADWTVMERISESKERVRKVRSQIRQVTDRLKFLSADAERDIASVKAQIDELILKAEV